MNIQKIKGIIKLRPLILIANTSDTPLLEENPFVNIYQYPTALIPSSYRDERIVIEIKSNQIIEGVGRIKVPKMGKEYRGEILLYAISKNLDENILGGYFYSILDLTKEPYVLPSIIYFPEEIKEFLGIKEDEFGVINQEILASVYPFLI
ncbi:MAG: hypothetical protein B6U78_00735 [Candidatus Aenigmarchaeota archaeon ex4484_224]|nr:MAG: hypothetical protein B6U78_00735 [Candidatus Aenigmarchaeota archaeon ex4484_224]